MAWAEQETLLSNTMVRQDARVKLLIVTCFAHARAQLVIIHTPSLYLPG